MTNLNARIDEYLEDWRGLLDTIETGLLSLEKNGAATGAEVIDGVLQNVQSLRTGAESCDFAEMRELAHRTESVLELIRLHKMVPTPAQVDVLLRVTDTMWEIVQHAGAINPQSCAESMSALQELLSDGSPPTAGDLEAARFKQSHKEGWHLRMLIVEDDFVSRLLLQSFLSRYGECHVAVNGREAVEAVRFGLEQGLRYDLICMDIMMPEMDGHEAVKRIRALEDAQGILSNRGSKIIMTTAVDNIKVVFRAFLELCDAYLVKPIDLSALLSKMKSYNLIP